MAFALEAVALFFCSGRSFSLRFACGFFTGDTGLFYCLPTSFFGKDLLATCTAFRAGTVVTALACVDLGLYQHPGTLEMRLTKLAVDIPAFLNIVADKAFGIFLGKIWGKMDCMEPQLVEFVARCFYYCNKLRFII